MDFPSQIFFKDIYYGYTAAILNKNYLWLLPFFMAVAAYIYYEKVHMRIVVVSHLLNTYFKKNWIKMHLKGLHWKVLLFIYLFLPCKLTDAIMSKYIGYI